MDRNAPLSRLFSVETCLVVGLALLTFVAYARMGGAVFVVLDDPTYVSVNPHIRDGLNARSLVWALTSFHAANWHPLTWVSHMLDVEMFGFWAGGHHLTSVFLHAINAGLLFALLRRETGALWRAFAVAALFALHPLQVESVAWVAERKNVLCTTLGLGALLAYGSYARRGGGARYAGVCALLALGLMAKPMLVTLPLILLLWDFWPLGRLRIPGLVAATGPRATARALPSLRFLLAEKLPLLALSAVASVLTVLAQASEGAFRDAVRLPLHFRVENAVVAYASYLKEVVWPDDLAMLHPHPSIVTGVSPWPAAQVALSTLLLLAITAGVVVATRHGRGRRNYLVTGWLWFLGALVPMIGIVQVGPQAMADRYVYLPIIGLFIALVWSGGDVAARFTRGPAALGMVGVLVVSGLALGTRWQTAFWRDSRVMLERSIEVIPDNWMAHDLLGGYFALQDEPGAAIEELRASIAIHERYAPTHMNLANVLSRQGASHEAIVHYRKAIELHPGSAQAHAALGSLLRRMGRSREGTEALERALVLAREQGQPNLAREIERALRSPPATPSTR